MRITASQTGDSLACLVPPEHPHNQTPCYGFSLGVSSAFRIYKPRRRVGASSGPYNRYTSTTMNIQSFLEHHGILKNPFAEEDAQTDPVFKEHCIRSAFHPVWDKVYGDPGEPATAIVFGPKGSGKTAMRLQIDQHLQRHNQDHPGKKVFIIRYDDFNPFLDQFSSRMGSRARRKPERVLDSWRLWDHMDAILCLAVTGIVDDCVRNPTSETRDTRARVSSIEATKLSNLDRASIRDLLLLACCYDQSTSESLPTRWGKLRKRLGYRNLLVHWDWAFAIFWIVLTVVVGGWLYGSERLSGKVAFWSVLAVATAGAIPYAWRWLRCQWWAMGIRRHLRVGKQETASLRKVLLSFPTRELTNQPLPRLDRTDDRYELINKFQTLLSQLGFSGTIVLMDRIDEPHLTGGKPELMRRFVWPLLDNKLLKHPGIGFKLMLPQELHRDVEREDRDFHERARLDKQNVIPAFAWSGEALFDLARNRMIACASDGKTINPQLLFDEKISYERLLAVFQSLRVPRHLFRFLYRVLVDHCNKYTDAAPRYKIDAETFEAVLAVYSREIESPA